MIFACHKGFALTRNEFYWGQISSYLNTSLPPEIQGLGNYFAIIMFFLGSDLGSNLWNILLSNTCYTSAKKANNTFIPFLAKKLSSVDSSFHLHWFAISVKHYHASLMYDDIARHPLTDTQPVPKRQQLPVSSPSFRVEPWWGTSLWAA